MIKKLSNVGRILTNLPFLKASSDENVPKLLAMMEHHLGCVNCIRWSGSGTFLASGGDDKLVSLT